MQIKIIGGPDFDEIEKALFHSEEARPIEFILELTNRQRKRLGIPVTDKSLKKFVTSPDTFRWISVGEICDLGGEVDDGVLAGKRFKAVSYSPDMDPFGTFVCRI